MDRMILFKGKRVDNGEWIYGSIITGVFTRDNQYIPYILSPYEAEYDCFKDFSEDNGIYEVDAETICQYTGLFDKSGRKIFEGDIFENQNRLKLEVRYGKFAMYCPVDNCMMENVGFYTVAEGYYEDMPLGPTEKYATIIGNIHDNPDLKVDDKYRCMAELN